ncbi:SRPBCC family protein [Thalassobellus citreus]|uniref:SRPBCC family protein n=1 Tax=Thalassobellus citreus TaxID=3367752 RepID=UPI0037903538
MTTLKNEIIINAPIEKIWEELSALDRLALYDPAVKESNVLTQNKKGKGAKRKVEMNDGKNWFEETCTIYEENIDLKYELNACSFPVHSLFHRYNFEKIHDNKYKVTQTQSYKMKYGLLGNLLGLAIKSKWNKGINDFLQGLKKISEQN